MCAREDDGARVDSRNRYRPVECLGEDWTRKRRGGRITGNERGRMNRSRSCTLFPPRIRPLPSRLLSRGLRERTTARAQARCLSPPTENQYVGRSVLSPAKSQFSHSTSSSPSPYFRPYSSLLAANTLVSSSLNGAENDLARRAGGEIFFD